MKVGSVGSRIKEAREHFGLSQKEFAELFGVKETTISEMEGSRCIVSDKFIKSLCLMFNISETWLMEGRGEMSAVGEQAAGDRLIEEAPAVMAVRTGTENFVRCDECEGCCTSLKDGSHFCMKYEGMHGRLYPERGDGCSHGRRITEEQSYGS